MNLKSIELVGFKSFADRTFVKLDNGITGIVGPNGCGKSNIVDALRWSLGEMSPRSLRSKQMLDVIFSGSSTRSPLNMSEVTLTFDNTHHLLPIDFTEVQVTRKLFRSGESEYFLNKTQCRLKDIKDLFMDTGMSEGYSILAQGEVDFVISSKPEERRVLFEEAAGISKYKARREETLRKLEKVDLDLNRLNDVLSLVGEQMRQLENAAKKAKVYKDIREELRQAEIADALSKLENLKKVLEESRGKNDALGTQSRQVTVDLDRAEAEWTENRLSLDECEKQLFTLNSKIFEFDKNIGIADQTLRLAAERETESAQRQLKARGQISQMAAQRADTLRKIEESQQELDSQSSQEQEFKNAWETQSKNWKSCSAARLELENLKAQKNKEFQEVSVKVEELKREQNKFATLNFNRELEIASLKKELEKITLSRGVLAQELENLKKSAQDLQQKIEQLSTDLPQIRENLSHIKNQEQSLRTQIQNFKNQRIQRQTQIETVQQFLASNPYRRGTEAILKQKFDGLKNVVGILLRYSADIAPWISTLLGNKLDYLVFETRGQAQAALDWLRTQDLGRATCLILEEIQNIDTLQTSIPESALSLMAQVQCEAQFDKLKQVLIGSAYVSGEKLYHNGIIDGGSAPSAGELESNPFLARENLQQEVLQINQNLENLEKELAQVSSKQETLRTEVNTKSQELSRLQLQSSHYQDLQKKKQQEVDSTQKEFFVLSEKSQKDEAQKLQFVQSAQTAQEKLEQTLARQGQLQTEREELQKQIEQQRTQEYDAGLLLKESEVRLENFRTSFKRVQQSLQEWKARFEMIEQRQKELELEIEQCQEFIVQNQNVQQEETLKIKNFHQQKSETANESESLLKQKSVFEEKGKTLDANLQMLRQNQKDNSDQLHQAEIQLRSMENESKNITARLMENYELTPAQALETIQPKACDPETLARLRKRVENMGSSINLEAPEQYEALNQRFEFLNKQVTDLQTAKEDLKKAIAQINASTKEQFKETFIKVRENFIKIFGVLFSAGGGVADLVFTDENNLLETGIDIVAQPPGKKPQNIALLSGGEKTLTAIALLFAFFMVKPSPFCVMDEVDAPLDPANVGRYLKLLKDFAEKTQFIVVTHNPKTMEMADVLYGVTMEESGVSRLLSAKLKKEDSTDKLELSRA